MGPVPSMIVFMSLVFVFILAVGLLSGRKTRHMDTDSGKITDTLTVKLLKGYLATVCLLTSCLVLLTSGVASPEALLTVLILLTGIAFALSLFLPGLNLAVLVIALLFGPAFAISALYLFWMGINYLGLAFGEFVIFGVVFTVPPASISLAVLLMIQTARQARQADEDSEAGTACNSSREAPADNLKSLSR